MKPIYSKIQFEEAKSSDRLPCQCYSCNSEFLILKRVIVNHLNGSKDKCQFCSQKCKGNINNNLKKVKCKNCDKEFQKQQSQIKDKRNNFCSNSCSVIYNNTHKTHGTRRSKLEKYLEEQLTSLYPNLIIDFNKKDTINSELDIYVPSLKLAFELNGIFHYEPIFGDYKLNQTQNNDQRKFQTCSEQGISLYTIDTSNQKYFKESTSQEFLNIITDIINIKSKNDFF